MRWLLEFNLPDDKDDLNIHQKADQYYLALHDIQDTLRSYCKHDDRSELPEVITGEILREWFYKVLKDRDIDL